MRRVRWLIPALLLMPVSVHAALINNSEITVTGTECLNCSVQPTLHPPANTIDDDRVTFWHGMNGLNTGDDFVALFKSRMPGLNHFCFTWPRKTASEAVRRLESLGIASRREENRVYFKDPDGLTVQVAGENDWNDWR